MQDTPILDAITGSPTNYGLLYNALTTNEQTFPGNSGQIPSLSLLAPYASQPAFPTTNYINYLTGEFTVTFATAPENGVPITSQTVPCNPSIPQSLLFFDGEFVVRPIPDQPYKVDMEVYVQPTELLASGQTPELSEWWQLIAWNAAKKVFEDKSDFDSVNMIMPSLKEQERLVLRRTIVQQTSQRTSTIYTEQVANQYNGFGNGGGSF
jgi:hypothetical protein